MNITAVLPTIIVVTDSTPFFKSFQAELKKAMPDLVVMCFSSRDATKYLDKYDHSNYETEGFDYWVPRESCLEVSRKFRRKIKHLIR